jgi:hypothetical protein
MPSPTIKSKTGNAPITKVGHTAANRFGSNPDAKVKGPSTSRDLSIK